MFIDTHAHLNFKAFKDDYKDAIKRAFEADVKSIINVGSNLETSQKAIEIAHQYTKNVYAAVSLHPIHVKDEKFSLEIYLQLAQDDKVVALGETGIDLYHDKDTIDLQYEVFEKVLEISKKVNKPLIIHSREADAEVLQLLEHKKPIGVLHCFGRNWLLAKKFLDLGLMLSFTGNITYHLTPEREEMLKKVPLDRIMIETDCPFMVPQPQRDQNIKRNEPAYVIEVAKKIAKIKNISLEKVAKQTTQNAQKLFNLDLK